MKKIELIKKWQNAIDAYEKSVNDKGVSLNVRIMASNYHDATLDCLNDLKQLEDNE
jgi:hypothetical protein